MTQHAHVRTRTGKQICLVGLTILLLAGFCFGQPAISLSRASGPPTTQLRVSGTGFAPYAKIDLYFGTKDSALAMADRAGSFSQIAIAAPASALPGTHWVSAVERSGHAGAQAKFLVSTSWTEFHRQNMQRWNPYENVLDIHNVRKLHVKWKFNVGLYEESSPAVANGVVYVPSDGPFYALNANTGVELWRYNTGGIVRCVPAVAQGVVYVGSDDSKLYALNASTGVKLWSYTTGNWVHSAPTVANGMVYFGSDDGYLYALNTSTGGLRWKHLIGQWGFSSPAVANGVVYANGLNSGNLYAFNARTGAKLWVSPGGGSWSPAVANGVVYTGQRALNAATGAVLWDSGIGAGGAPAVANGVVYFGAGSSVYALDASTGATLWSHATINAVYSSPAVANGVVYVGSGTDDGSNNDALYALNASTGAELWRFRFGDFTYNSPVVVNGVVYFGAYSHLSAFVPKIGQEKAEANSKRPDLQTLRSDFSLRVSQRVAVPARAD
jgi:outer membrane protein assembly factor BamB